MRFIVRRLVFYAVAAWVALTVNFFVPRAIPGNVVEAIMSKYPNLTPPAEKALEAMLGVGHPGSLWHQYSSYLSDVVHFNFGTDLVNYPAKVSTLLAQDLPWTIILVGVATVMAFVIGTALGILAGWRTGGWLDRALPALTFVQALPYFFLALILLELFAQTWHIFPLGQGYDGQTVTPGWNWPFIASAIGHSALPAFTIVITNVAGWMLQMRNVMITTVGEDYVLAAQAKGLRNRRVVFTYAARNAILPQLSGFANALGFVVAGAIVMEIVFSYPGIGLLLLNAVSSNDYPLMQAIFLVITFAVLLANLFVDIVYVLVDPRARARESLMAIALPISTQPTVAGDAPRRRGFWGRLPTKAKVGAIIIGFFVLIAIIGPFLAPYNGTYQNPAPSLSLHPPDLAHLLGTTVSGQDVFSQLLAGIRLTMILALIVGVVATALAAIIGVSAGFLGGTWDESLSLFSNVVLVIPALPLLVVLLGYFPQSGQAPTILALSALSWPWGARVIRSQTLAIRNRDFVAAARETGEGRWRIIVFDIVPNEISLIAASFVNTVLYAIGASVALAFLGVADLNSFSLGTMLYWAENQAALSLGAWWWFVPPGVVVALMGTGLVLLNFGIDELGNPRLRDVANARRLGARKWFPADPTLVARTSTPYSARFSVVGNGAGPGAAPSLAVPGARQQP